MDPATIVTLALQSSASDLVSSWLRKRSVRAGSTVIRAEGEKADDSEHLSAIEFQELLERISRIEAKNVSEPTEVSDSGKNDAIQGKGSVVTEALERETERRPLTDALSRRLLAGAGSVEPVPSYFGALALDSPPEVFLTARKRIALVFRLNVCLALMLAFILFGAIILLIGSAFTGRSALAGVFAGSLWQILLVSTRSSHWLRISSAVVASQRLEIIHMRLLSQLRTCAEQSDIEKRFKCQTGVWNAIQRDIASMSSKTAGVMEPK